MPYHTAPTADRTALEIHRCAKCGVRVVWLGADDDFASSPFGQGPGWYDLDDRRDCDFGDES